MLYAFILGKNQALSVAEILSVLKRDRFVFVILSISAKALIIKLDNKIENPQDFLNKLGGTIKIAQIFTSENEKDVMGPILGFAMSNFKEQKFVFGISSYGSSFPRLGFEVKKELKKVGVNSRFVMGKEKELSAPEIKNNKMLSHGADFVLIRDEKKVFIGNTVAIQDYESYSHRDYDRPRRNAKSGMLPPKIAQVMINLIPSKTKNLVYDPFCGNGTVLQEASLMGYDVMGSDISKDRIYDTKENLKWLSKEYGVTIDLEKNIFQSDALELSEDILPVKPDVIVSEVYLGPPLTDKLTPKEAIEITDGMNKKYSDFLKNTLDFLPSTRYVILAIPVYIVKGQKYYLNIIDEAKKIGYNVISPIEMSEYLFDLPKEYNKSRKTVLYSREDQIVGREIIVLERK